MKRFVTLFVLTAVAANAWADDAPPAVKAAFDIKLVAKPGDVFRFRQSTKSGTETDGKPVTEDEASQEYSVTVKAARPDGGLDVHVLIERLAHRTLPPEMDTWLEYDSSKPVAAGADIPTQAMSAVLGAMIGRPFSVSLDAHGAPVAVSGLREVVAEGLKGSPLEDMLESSVDQMFPDAAVMRVAEALFLTSPRESHAVGGKWNAETQEFVSGGMLGFSVDSTLTAATADAATIESKFTWKPDEAARAGDAKAAGGGESSSVISRRDGLVVSTKKHLAVTRDTSVSKTAMHIDLSIERLPPAAAKAADAATPPKK